MDDDLFVAPTGLGRKKPIVRYVPCHCLLQCSVCGNPILLQGKYKSVDKATVIPCRHCLQAAREQALKEFILIAGSDEGDEPDES